MRGEVRLLACLVGVVVPWLVAGPGATLAGDETFHKSAVITIPGGLNSFDISFVDADIQTLVLADRTNKAVDVVDTSTNTVVSQLTSSPAFAGVRAAPANASGPNGVIIVDHREAWAADAPSSCTAGPPASCTHDSSLKAIDIKTGNTIAVMNTGGQRRADELCEDVRREVVLVANDDALDSFITFWSTETHQKLGQITFLGSDANGNNILANGIEQCQWDPRIDKFVLNIPATGTAASPGPGVVVTISTGHSGFHVEQVFTIDPSTGCTGPQGLAIGPRHELLLGCGGANSLIIDDRNGSTLAFLGGQGNADEVWYNPGDNQYFIAESGNKQLGVVDASGAEDVPAATATGSHSVAVDMLRNQVYVPANQAATTLCGSSNGCIAVFTAVGKDDHCLAQGMPVMGHDDGDDPVFMRTRCKDGHDHIADRNDHDR